MLLLESTESELGSIGSSEELAPVGTACSLVYLSQSTSEAAAGRVVVAREEDMTAIRGGRRQAGQTSLQSQALGWSRAKKDSVCQGVSCSIATARGQTAGRASCLPGKICSKGGNAVPSEIRPLEICIFRYVEKVMLSQGRFLLFMR